jgi:membrane dipeptidase
LTEVRVFDGHVDTLLKQYVAGLPSSALLEETSSGALDIPRARRGGMVGAFFAVFAPWPPSVEPEPVFTDEGWEIPLALPIPHPEAVALTAAIVGRLLALERSHSDSFVVVRSPESLEECLLTSRFAVVLHLEGAEAIDPALDNLEMWYAAGVRSIGPLWSRPNAFGHGVPFRFPGSPDSGPGLTSAGLRLVERCNDLGIVLDCSHLNQAGFWDVARHSRDPLAVTHTAAHALSPFTRCLTDSQLRAVAETDGVVGVMFDTSSIRPDGLRDAPHTPVSIIADHVRYIADLIGVDHVAIGSDFDGARMPEELSDASKLPMLMNILEQYGFSLADRRAIAADNWSRLLGNTLRAADD